MTAPTRRAAIGCAVIALAAAPAHAHIVNTGLGAIYDGIVHFFYAPEDLLGALALACAAGLMGGGHALLMTVVLPLAWYAGVLAGLLWGGGAALDAASAASCIAAGALLAADRRLPPSALALAAAAYGVLHGFLNGAAAPALTRPAIHGLGATSAAVLATTALVSAVAYDLRNTRLRIAMRVLGSWAAAIGLLLLGWAYRTQP